MYNMKLRGATTVLKKECVFLGLSMSSLFTMIKRNPGAFPNKTLLAYKIYTAQEAKLMDDLTWFSNIFLVSLGMITVSLAMAGGV